MFYFDNWCEKYIAELFPGFVRHITSQNAVRFVRRIPFEGGPLRINQEIRIVLSPVVFQKLHRATPQHAAEIGKQAFVYLQREISARMALSDLSEIPMNLYLDEELLK